MTCTRRYMTSEPQVLAWKNTAVHGIRTFGRLPTIKKQKSQRPPRSCVPGGRCQPATHLQIRYGQLRVSGPSLQAYHHATTTRYTLLAPGGHTPSERLFQAGSGWTAGGTNAAKAAPRHGPHPNPPPVPLTLQKISSSADAGIAVPSTNQPALRAVSGQWVCVEGELWPVERTYWNSVTMPSCQHCYLSPSHTSHLTHRLPLSHPVLVEYQAPAVAASV
jgi:hypothetical protein